MLPLDSLSSVTPVEVRLFQVLGEKNKELELQDILDEIDNLEVLINIHNTNGYTALHVACCNNHLKYVQLLITKVL
jgi:ankyrin repeat protein